MVSVPFTFLPHHQIVYVFLTCVLGHTLLWFWDCQLSLSLLSLFLFFPPLSLPLHPPSSPSPNPHLLPLSSPPPLISSSSPLLPLSPPSPLISSSSPLLLLSSPSPLLSSSSPLLLLSFPSPPLPSPSSHLPLTPLPSLPSPHSPPPLPLQSPYCR